MTSGDGGSFLDKAKDMASGLVDDAKETIAEAGETLSEKTADLKESAGGMLEGAGEKLSEAKDAASEKAAELKDKAADMAGDAKEAMSEKLSETDKIGGDDAA